MNLKTIGAGIFGTSALVLGGVDASVLKEQPINRTETVAGYVVEAKQIGNVVEADFPWKDQTGIKVKYDMGEPTTKEKLSDKRKQQVITETVTDFEGGFKVDIILGEKPDTNVFCYAIEGAENYDFFYQPPLTSEEIAAGDVRPPEIEGSYAVYHKTLKNHIEGKTNYETGKVMHIPRPQVWSLSDESTKERADLSYDERGLCVTAPQDFLDKAKYPVRIDPTFGYTTHGASQLVGYQVASAVFASVSGSFVAGTGDTITSYSLWGNNPSANNATVNVVAFSVVTGVVTNQLTSSAFLILTNGSSDQLWTTATVSHSLSGSTGYAIGISCELCSPSTVNIDYDNGSAPGRFNSTRTTFPGTGNSFSPTGTDSGRQYSAYATYTAGGGGGSSTTPNQDIIFFD